MPAEHEDHVVATTLPAGTLTYDDYLAVVDDDRHELRNGELVMVPAPSYTHQAVQLRLSRRLGAYSRPARLRRSASAKAAPATSAGGTPSPSIGSSHCPSSR